MKTRLRLHVAEMVSVLLLAGSMGAWPAVAQAPGASPQPPRAAPAPESLQSVWRSGDTTMRIAINGAEARGVFAEVGQGAKALGFKPGEASFVATTAGSYLSGQQTIRYSTPNCHPNGRKVPMMGRMTPDGQALAIHFYNVTVDPNCRDTGQYRVIETLWQRVPAR